MTRNDLILTAALAILSLTPLLIFAPASEKKFVTVKVSGEIYRRLDLSQEETFEIISGEGRNLVEIKNGTVAVIEANCPDKVCVKTGAIHKVGEVIACVPNEILIEIAGD